MIDSKDFLETILENIPDMIFVKEAKELRFVRFNKAGEKLLGYSREELLGKNDYDFFPKEEADFFTQKDREVLASGKLLEIPEEVIHTKEGIRILHTKKIPVYKENGEPYLLVGISEDITERKRSEEMLVETNRRLKEALEELKEMQAYLIQQERLKALGQMASGIAHDFNNTLSPIVGFSDLILNHPELLNDHQKVMRYMQLIGTAARDAANVVSRLKEFYRPRDEDEIFIPVNINSIINDSISLTQPRWKNQALANGIEIHIETDLQDIPPILGKPSELREALTNLIFNSVDALPNGGTIKIKTEVKSSIDFPKNFILRNNNIDKSSFNQFISLSISDNGVGMTPEVKKRCFDPFFSTKGEHGTGMGLPMVYGIISRHNGVIDVESEVGVGTKITLCFPVYQNLQRDIKHDLVKSSKYQFLNILVIDDEPGVCKFLEESLTLDGHSVTYVLNGNEGLEKFSKNKYDIVIIDHTTMSGINIQIATNIKKVSPKTPIILLTGLSSLLNSNISSIDAILNKPITFKELKESINRLILSKS